MSLRYLLDTNIISEPLRTTPDSGVMEKLAANAGRQALSAITWHELLFGLERLPMSHRRLRLQRYLDDVAQRLDVLPYDEEAATWHARERARPQGIGLVPPFQDGQIAAIAATRGLILVSRNTSDFKGFSGLVGENWFSG